MFCLLVICLSCFCLLSFVGRSSCIVLSPSCLVHRALFVVLCLSSCFVHLSVIVLCPSRCPPCFFCCALSVLLFVGVSLPVVVRCRRTSSCFFCCASFIVLFCPLLSWFIGILALMLYRRTYCWFAVVAVGSGAYSGAVRGRRR